MKLDKRVFTMTIGAGTSADALVLDDDDAMAVHTLRQTVT